MTQLCAYVGEGASSGAPSHLIIPICILCIHSELHKERAVRARKTELVSWEAAPILKSVAVKKSTKSQRNFYYDKHRYAGTAQFSVNSATFLGVAKSPAKLSVNNNPVAFTYTAATQVRAPPL